MKWLRTYGVAIGFAVITSAAIALAVTAVSQYQEGLSTERKLEEKTKALREFKAMVATGPCGTEQFVLVDDTSLAVAGTIVSHEILRSYRFETSSEGRQVVVTPEGKRIVIGGQRQ